jgi:hypothetical protein
MNKLVTIGVIGLITFAVMGFVGQRTTGPAQPLPPPHHGRIDAYHLTALAMILITAAAIRRLLHHR